MLFQDADENLTKLVEGQDFKAFNKLMEMVEANTVRL